MGHGPCLSKVVIHHLQLSDQVPLSRYLQCRSKLSFVCLIAGRCIVDVFVKSQNTWEGAFATEVTYGRYCDRNGLDEAWHSAMALLNHVWWMWGTVDILLIK